MTEDQLSGFEKMKDSRTAGAFIEPNQDFKKANNKMSYIIIKCHRCEKSEQLNQDKCAFDLIKLNHLKCEQSFCDEVCGRRQMIGNTEEEDEQDHQSVDAAQDEGCEASRLTFAGFNEGKQKKQKVDVSRSLPYV